MKENVQELVELWTFLNRLHVLKEYFGMCLRSSSCFKAGNNTIVGTLFPSGDEIARPLKVYVTEYFRRCMLGLSSLCLSVLVCNFVNLSEPNLLTNLPDANSGPTKLSISELTKVSVNRQGLTLGGTFSSFTRQSLQTRIINLFLYRHMLIENSPYLEKTELIS